jgi:spermidine synthase
MANSPPLGNTLPHATPSTTRLLLLLPLFMGSGCAALVYEIVWLQLLQLVIGSTAVSLGVLLGTFMGGMCLGSLLLPRLVSSRRHPLRIFAALELGVGAIAMAVLHGMPHIEKLYASAAGGGWIASLALRGALSMVCLLPPAMLMGATLPALSRWVETTPKGVAWLGFLYGANIAGAVAGCLLAGFYLLRVSDMAATTYAAVALNLSVSAISVALSALWSYRPACPAGGAAAEAQAQSRGAARQWNVYIVIALSGLTALGAEVVWTRLLSLLLGGTVYTFSGILAIFLLGLGIGSAAGSFLVRAAHPRLALGYAQLFLAGAIAWAAWALSDSLPYWPVNPMISISPSFTFQLDLLRCLYVVLPGAFLWGASFPLALAAAALPGQDPGRLVAGVYAANTVGAIAGALAFSLLLIPTIGSQWSQRVMLMLSSLSAVVCLALGRRPREAVPAEGAPAPMAGKPAAWLTIVGLAAALALTPLLTWKVSPMPWAAVGFGRFCASYVPEVYPGVLDMNEVNLLKYAESWHVTLRVSSGEISYEPQSSGRPGEAVMAAAKPVMDPWIKIHRAELLSALRKGQASGRQEPSSAAYGGGVANWHCALVKEGVNVSVAVSEDKDSCRYFHGAGKVQASTHPQDMRLQRMLGHLTMLARRDPDSVRSVLVVGCGAGVTAGSFTLYEGVRRIVICDIEPVVPKWVAPLFAAQNYNVVADPRTEIVLDDGRHFLCTTKEKFDVITSDPIDPWVKGCAALNTREYYQMCKAHLNPGGIAALWFPLYQSDAATAKSGIATFFDVFPDGIIWSNDSSGEGYDMVLFGQAEPVEKINVDRLQEWLNAHPAVCKSLKDVNFGSRRPLGANHGETPEAAVDLLATYAGQAADLAEWLRGAQINTDLNLRLQYLAGLSLNLDLSKELFDDILLYYRYPDNLIEGSEARTAALIKVLAASGRKPSPGAGLPAVGAGVQNAPQ